MIVLEVEVVEAVEAMDNGSDTMKEKLKLERKRMKNRDKNSLEVVLNDLFEVYTDYLFVGLHNNTRGLNPNKLVTNHSNRI